VIVPRPTEENSSEAESQSERLAAPVDTPSPAGE
jgi:hypothetical protein